MNEGVKKVLETIGKDEEFAKKMSQCKSPGEAYELAKTVADGFTLEELRDVMTKIHNMHTAAAEKELTDDDLVEISGGISKETEAYIGTGIMVAASASAAATAI